MTLRELSTGLLTRRLSQPFRKPTKILPRPPDTVSQNDFALPWFCQIPRTGVQHGNRTTNSAPFPSSLATLTLPPCASTTAFTKLSPSPNPRWLRLLSPR